MYIDTKQKGKYYSAIQKWMELLATSNLAAQLQLLRAVSHNIHASSQEQSANELHDSLG